jgi:acyl-coenzyme A thioesterase PaaI-like protein
MENVKLIDASPTGTVDFEFHIDEQYTNINGVMHGGAAGVIFDMCTTTALGPLAKPGFWEYEPFPLLSFSFLLPYLPKSQLTKIPLSFLGGVTRTLNISYLRAIPMGSLFHLPIFTSLAHLFFPPHTLVLLMPPPRNHNSSSQRSLSNWPHNGHDPRNHDKPRRQNYLLYV